MNDYQRLFEQFPEAESIAMAGIYGIEQKITEFKLSKYIYIMPRRDEFDKLYHPRMSNLFRKPDYYIIAISTSNRHAISFKKIENLDDVLGSISIAHQALCIFHSSQYALGQIEGFSKNSTGSYGLSNPEVAGRNSEFNDPLFKQESMFHLFNIRLTGKNQYDQELVDFFEKLANVYILTKEKRWILSAKMYTSGVNRHYVEDAILDFAVALESLLALDKEQINFKLRLYLALLVGDSFGERKQIYTDIKVFYGLRSKLVHGDMLSISDENIRMISRVGDYLSRALIRTCGKKIKEEVLPDLEFMSLLGAPRLTKEKNDLVITEREILNLILKHQGITEYISYEAFLTEEKEPDKEFTELIIRINFSGAESKLFYARHYKGLHDALRNHKSYSYWVSKDSENGYFYNITYYDTSN